MTDRNILHAYINSFDGVSLAGNYIMPILCPIRSGTGSRVITLANGVAYNANGTSRGIARYPIEQEFTFLIRGASGTFVDGLLYNIDTRLFKQGSLRCYVPDGSTYKCEAVLDEIEKRGSGIMADNYASWDVYVLRFLQLNIWSPV